MAFDKVVEARAWGVTNQNSTTRLTMGDSTGGTFTAQSNLLRGSLVWDECQIVLTGVSVAGGATGGSYTITVDTDALIGYTGLPVMGVSAIGPNTRGRIVLTNLHRSMGAVLPTHLNVTQDAAGGGIWFQAFVLAKRYRGSLPTPSAKTAERVIQGTAIRGASYAGGPFTSGAGFGANQTVAVGNSLSRMGLDRMRMWDRAFYWAVAGNSISGTHDVAVLSTVNGLTFTIASTVGSHLGPLSAAGEKLPLVSNFGGASPNYTHMIWTVVSAGGVSDARLVVCAKTGRGSIVKP